MEKLLNSKERTLVIFDVVCSGLSSCLSLVHKDIKQMTEHRNRLAQFEQDQQSHAKLITASELEAVAANLRHISNNNNNDEEPKCSVPRRKIARQQSNGVANISDEKVADDDDDPHHLAALRLLDKGLAESFSQVLSLNDMQRSSIAAKQRSNPNRTSIFQVLLGKSGSNNKQSNNNNNSTDNKNELCHSLSNNKHDGQNGEATNDNQTAVDNKLIIDDINRQIRLAMQYSKQLETHLLKVEDLKARYEMHIKMGLVVRSVSHAYLPHAASSSQINSLARRSSKHLSSIVMNDIPPLSTHSSSSSTWSMNTGNSRFGSSKSKNHQNNAFGGNKTSVKEFVDNINKIETELESFMGSFLFTIENIQGFARICHGDVFEVSIKLGNNKHKLRSKISILKGDKQKCDNRQAVFKAGIADMLTIKAYECKGLGKRVLLCNKICETRDLFTARSQLMTISLNNLGSIKLNLIATWNPLHLTPNCSSAIPGLDLLHISLPPTPVSTSTISSLSSVPSLNGGTTTTINIQSQPRGGSHKSSSPNRMEDQQQHRHHHHHHHYNNHHLIQQQQQQQLRQHQQQLHQQQLHQELLYQAVNPNHSYYIPAPDYPMDEIE